MVPRDTPKTGSESEREEHPDDFVLNQLRPSLDLAIYDTQDYD